MAVHVHYLIPIALIKRIIVSFFSPGCFEFCENKFSLICVHLKLVELLKSDILPIGYIIFNNICFCPCFLSDASNELINKNKNDLFNKF